DSIQRTSSGGKLAQSVIIQRLDDTNEHVQATLLELIVAKELKISNARYTVPKPYFIVIVVLPQNYKRTNTSSQLEIKALAAQVSHVHINIDITRYIRDIVVGIRTHPLVQGGLTARSSQEFVIVTK
ncbi:hypothetical protein BDB00DRAFT_775817, partial [Zychaea mexicana]|uniref:uncharacterized protein n=1 Tax=Zychaea mexicana TaxID=64656 RepID=UPI0022FE40DC